MATWWTQWPISALGSGLGMTTTAEGVETEAQAALVAADGCTDIQGYLIGRQSRPARSMIFWENTDRTRGPGGPAEMPMDFARTGRSRRRWVCQHEADATTV